MNEISLPLNEIVPKEKHPDWWIGPDFASVGFNFHAINEIAVCPRFTLNHLLSMAELHQFSRELLFDNTLLRQLRDSVSSFATTGKVTASHLPLPRPELVDKGFSYSILGNTYEARDITPGLHSSDRFVRDNSKQLPISDFQDFITTTKIQKDSKTIGVNKIDVYLPVQSIARYMGASNRVFFAEFDKSTHEDSWSIQVLQDKANPATYWIEFMVLTAEQLNARREHATPYLVLLQATPDIIDMFTAQLKTAIDACPTNQERHKLLYYLTSVLYFQSDPELPYLPEDIKPYKLNGALPYDVTHISIGVKDIQDAPVIFQQALQQKDGLVALEHLYNLGQLWYAPGDSCSLAQIVTELKKIFGPAYELASESVRAGIQNVSREVDSRVANELAHRQKSDEYFDALWKEKQQMVIDVTAQAFGFGIVTPDSPLYDRLITMMKLKDTIASYRTINKYSGREDIRNNSERNIRWAIKSLASNAMRAYMNDQISIIVKRHFSWVKIPRARRNVVRVFDKLLNNIEISFGIPAKEIQENFFRNKWDKNPSVGDEFDQELNMRNYSK